MSFAITSAASRPILTGTIDNSRGVNVVEETPLPTLAPALFIFAEKGTTEPSLVFGGDKLTRYGAETFEPTSAYFTHQTYLSNAYTQIPQIHTLIRLKPKDANPPAGMGLFLDIATAEVPVYERNDDNSVVRNADGTKKLAIPAATVAGHSLKWVVKAIDRINAAGEIITEQMVIDSANDPLIDITPVGNNFGKLTVGDGDRLNLDSTASTLYPIAELEAADFGKAGNWGGIKLWAPTTKDAVAVDNRVIDGIEAMLYRLQIQVKRNDKSTPLIQKTVNGDDFVEFTFKRNTVHPVFGSTRPLSVDRVLDLSYDDGSHFGRIHWYHENILTVSGALQQAEAAVNPEVMHDAEDPESWHKMNIVNGRDINGNELLSISIDTTEANLNEFTLHYAKGGSDGTLTDATYNELVKDYCDNWGSGEYPLGDVLRYPIRDIYDTGFQPDTKDAIINLLGKSQMLCVKLGTHIHGEGPLTPGEEAAFGEALQNKARMHPESVFHGTATARAEIYGQCGMLVDNVAPGYFSHVLDVAAARAAYMHPPSRIWLSRDKYTRSPNNVVRLLRDMSNSYMNDAVRERLWAGGVNWAQSTVNGAMFRPTHQTVYPDATSVLNSAAFADIISYLNYVSVVVWTKLAGIDDLTDAEFIEESDRLMAEEVEGLFDNRVEVTPRTEITKSDRQRRYSWHAAWEVSANGMRGVGVYTVEAYNADDIV